ncbi:MAG: hypothetical protein ACHP7P_02345 [Terriglobales bacterium]
MRLMEIQQSGRQSDQAFVAMWFTAETNLLYDEAIAPAVRDAGYRPFRVDRHEHVNRIDDEIIAQLRRSRFMVGDFTGQRQGVYYEAGFMGGLGRRVIWMCPKEELHQVHFDTRQYSFIVYEDPAAARKGLYNRILAVEDEGPNATARKT